jgi:hypothetical protein
VVVTKTDDEAAVPHHPPSLTAAADAFAHGVPPFRRSGLHNCTILQEIGIVPIWVLIVKLGNTPIQILGLWSVFWTWTAIFV